jgi:hypothetical protein
MRQTDGRNKIPHQGERHTVEADFVSVQYLIAVSNHESNPRNLPEKLKYIQEEISDKQPLNLHFANMSIDEIQPHKSGECIVSTELNATKFPQSERRDHSAASNSHIRRPLPQQPQRFIPRLGHRFRRLQLFMRWFSRSTAMLKRLIAATDIFATRRTCRLLRCL